MMLEGPKAGQVIEVPMDMPGMWMQRHYRFKKALDQSLKCFEAAVILNYAQDDYVVLDLEQGLVWIQLNAGPSKSVWPKWSMKVLRL